MGKQNPVRLGEILVENGWISEYDLNKALDYQKMYGGLLGNILIDFGWAEESKVVEAIKLIHSKGKIGELLIDLGILTVEQLDSALEFQQKSGGALGEILLSLGLVDAQTLFRTIATQQGMGRIGSEFTIDFSVKIPEEIANRFQAIVLRANLHRVVVAVAKILSKEQVNILESTLENKIEQVISTHDEMEMLWSLVYPGELMMISTEKLANERPDQSARTIFTRRQIILIVTILVLIVLRLCFNRFKTALIINIFIQVVYFIVVLLKFFMIMQGTRNGAQIRITDEEVESLDERKLPVYTILVPMYKESRVILALLENLELLDYPKHKLDIRLLVEEDDVEAQELLESQKLKYYYTIIVVPHALPKTKPKACNYGLINARGEYTVIYDAEDRPDLDQLKKVYLAFARSPESCCCIQGKLNYYNSNQNMLTRWFTQEYSMWFDLLLPGLMKLNIPIPLGGTSNHFKTEILKSLNAWDPYNVTEDADLGIRLYASGYTTGIVNSRTWEEANSRIGNWIRQRSRWIKGYMQTWLVHMRFPLRLWRQVGTRGMIGLQVITLATPILPLINPFLWLMLLLWFTTHYHLIPMLFPGPIYYMAAIELIIGNFIFVFSNIVGVFWVIDDLQEKGNYALSFKLVKYALLTPIYWALMSIAAYKAVWQLITNPFYWEKTDHGLTKFEN
ncbi:glycosyltransferase family 2 protein [Clostridium estertheticum]|uniref:Glycosyl transferase n=1 Tax=Clostridium estertheticum subsp. estertheticum TaxID=1552 RepID=A0A1J0GKV6_9CLOT|nr:glycosyltransferase family 2 protein [Clostridium estertheticum]APC41919.1 glycosyl transferase [Clostridium estertheticum subsp. estertheticum]MBU3073226.1 glycosyltransferase [Clostridium estertheticum]MBU3163533.1 glycosyltransferase [Clostridium estertheticum]MBZ9616176.1 glycosyltransferase [Clostridium estertheticum subsp. laramiense]WAG71922.1 glycosyltransferase [Clostridium estertheticum]